MTELKNVIKYLDIVLDKVDGTNSFNLSSIISENCSVNEKDNNELAIFLKLCDSVEMLGTTYKYFEKIEYAIEQHPSFLKVIPQKELETREELNKQRKW